MVDCNKLFDWGLLVALKIPRLVRQPKVTSPETHRGTGHGVSRMGGGLYAEGGVVLDSRAEEVVCECEKFKDEKDKTARQLCGNEEKEINPTHLDLAISQ